MNCYYTVKIHLRLVARRWGTPPRDFLEEPAAQFPPNHLLAPSGLLRIYDVFLG
ncbi:MAG: hypothetical protein HYW48_11545 [Deltaproteobacteria bacterium]|nr:hypothetical protein [Deltaproteobacteria bacterium]